MRYLAALLLITSFVGIGVFGFAIFDHAMMDGSNNGCAASAIDGTACPTSKMAMTLHHVSALQTLMTTMPPISGWLSLLAALLLVSVSTFLFYKDSLLPKLELLPQRLRDLTAHAFRSKQKIISWLSLFELSPAFS